jgi:hypothetical protein
MSSVRREKRTRYEPTLGKPVDLDRGRGRGSVRVHSRPGGVVLVRHRLRRRVSTAWLSVRVALFLIAWVVGSVLVGLFVALCIPGLR